MLTHATITTTLRAAGCVFAEDEADLLIAAAGSPAALTAMVARRAGGHPLEQVLGWAGFLGHRIALAPGVFVPRRRTEFLAATAISLTPPGATVLDLCCGSGAVAVALAAAVPGLEVHACDLDPAATACARGNLPGATIHTGDLFAPLPASLRGRLATLIANTPYVPTGEIPFLPPEARDHEPRSALDGGPDGLDLQRRVAAEAPVWLAPGGHLLVETSLAQAPVTAAFFAGNGLTSRIMEDEALGATIVVGTRPGRDPRSQLVS
ncbi:putative protein N(5)-glutamine methyltransferase [Actinocorallia longicatena]|uniref:peptide chain release factor N(5)-glutamine methyltransferase n=1 Tax=Actinocorallia longicatena TaxID=111803 RepID=A0ABP6PXM6_9ACTN